MAFPDALLTRGFVVPINFTAGGAGDTTVRAAVTGRGWVITYLHLECSASIDLLFKSGTTALTGVIAITGTQVYDFEASGAPILKSSASGEAFVINCSGAADVDGWAYMMETV